MLTILAVFIPVVIAMLIGIRRIRPDDDFFHMHSEASLSQYRDTTVAFTLQVAVTVYFIYWGFAYGWANIFYIFTWYLGLFLFYSGAKYLAPAVRDNKTMFEFLESRTSPLVRAVASALTSLSLLGLLYVELFYTSKFSSTATQIEIGTNQSAVWFWLSFFGLSICAALYTAIGGMRKVVETDSIQLGTAYIAAAILLISLFPRLAQQGFSVYTTISLLSIGVFLGIAFGNGLRGAAGGSALGAQAAWIILLLAYIYFIPISRHALTNAPHFPRSLFSQIDQPFGWVPLLAFTIANAIWQYSDFTAFHRLTIMKRPESEAEQVTAMRAYIRSTLITSPLTWGIGIVIGMAIYCSQIVGTNVIDVFSAFVTGLVKESLNGDVLSTIGVVSFGVFLSTVLVSTMDSTLVSLAQIIEVDLFRENFKEHKRMLLFILVIVFLSVLAFVQLQAGIDILVFLGGFYAVFLSIGPLMIRCLHNPTVNRHVAVMAVFMGAAIGTYFVISPPHSNYNVLLVLPFIAAIATSFTLLFLESMLFRKAKADPTEVEN